MIKDIAFTVYPAKDVTALRAWYGEKLGLSFGAPFAEDGIDKYDEARVGSGFFSVMASEWMDREPGSASGIVFEVDDIDQTVAGLRAKGVTIEDPYATPVCKIASCEDLEGNKVSFHQITVPH